LFPFAVDKKSDRLKDMMLLSYHSGGEPGVSKRNEKFISDELSPLSLQALSMKVPEHHD
jgi:hypothetical protein